jgi:endoglucanase
MNLESPLKKNEVIEFNSIKDKGFDSVRLPIKFFDYAKASPEFILDEESMKNIDEYINKALDQDLVVILDFYRFPEIMDEPERYKSCFMSIWAQLAERYKDYSPKLIFELLNEPRGNLRDDLWNDYIKECVNTIRKTNNDRRIIVGPDSYYSVDRLKALEVPSDDNILVSFHFYEPKEFALQGSKYNTEFKDLKDVRWNGSKQEIKFIKEKFDMAKKWSENNDTKIFLGEFKTQKSAPEDCRKLWMQTIQKQCVSHGFSFGYTIDNLKFN